MDQLFRKTNFLVKTPDIDISKGSVGYHIYNCTSYISQTETQIQILIHNTVFSCYTKVSAETSKIILYVIYNYFVFIHTTRKEKGT